MERVAADLDTEMVEQVRRLIMTASSLREARERIYDIYNELPTPALADLMAQAQATAALAGMDEVDNQR
jgi:phage gp29-like protein